MCKSRSDLLDIETYFTINNRPLGVSIGTGQPKGEALYPYRWEKGLVYESLPSRLHWVMSLIALIAVFWFLIITSSLVDSIDVLSRVLERPLILWGFGAWLLWRMSLMGLRITSAIEFLYFTFPRMRQELETFPPYDRLAILYTGYAKSDVEVHNALLGVFKASFRYGARTTTLIAAMSKNEKGEKEFRLLDEIRRVAIQSAESKEEAEFYGKMEVRAFAQDGSGKRAALKKCIEAVKSLGGADVYYLMDGDSIPTPDAFQRSIPFFQQDPRLGGITLENYSYTQGSGFFNLYSHLRFVRRRVDLGYATTVLTGRGSFIRGEILESDEALQLLDAHFIEWSGPQGIVKALTGDDKTTLYLTWSKGYTTLFVPDVYLYAMEEPLPLEIKDAEWVVTGLRWLGLLPLLSVIRQETRYTRNMLLVGKALWEVRPPDWLVFLKLLDQRYFFWAGLVGPISAISAAVVYEHPGIISAWVLTSLVLRTGVTLLQGIVRGYWHPLMPMVSFVNVVQALVKVFGYYNIGRAKWNRDGESVEGPYDWISPTLTITMIFTTINILLAI